MPVSGLSESRCASLRSRLRRERAWPGSSKYGRDYFGAQQSAITICPLDTYPDNLPARLPTASPPTMSARLFAPTRSGRARFFASALTTRPSAETIAIRRIRTGTEPVRTSMPQGARRPTSSIDAKSTFSPASSSRTRIIAASCCCFATKHGRVFSPSEHEALQ